MNKQEIIYKIKNIETEYENPECVNYEDIIRDIKTQAQFIVEKLDEQQECEFMKGNLNCSICKHEFSKYAFEDIDDDEINFCPNCGSKIKKQ